MKVFNKSELLQKRRELRAKSTPAEKKLWTYLRNRRFQNLKFKRQVSIDYYIVDFYNAEYKLAIELDGAHHYTKEVMEYDIKRTNILNGYGVKVIRFSNQEVRFNIKGVLQEINNQLTSPSLRDTPP